MDVAGEMESSDTLIWDRLGRSGRALHPSAQHYSPEAKATFEERGVAIKFLPPKGKYFNPLELLFNDLKTHYIRPKFPKMVYRCQSRKSKSLFKDMSTRRRRLRYALSFVLVRMELMQRRNKFCNSNLIKRSCQPCFSIARCTTYRVSNK